MTDPHRPVPDRPHLDTADAHRAAAEHAAARGDYDTALRERFRAVVRGLEQHGVLEVRRSRTAHETSREAAQALPAELSDDIPTAAGAFDDVVYGGRPAAAEDYLRLARADRFSTAAPPPAPEPHEVDADPRGSRPLPQLPAAVRDSRLWAALAASVVVLLLLFVLVQSCVPGAPDDPAAPPVDSTQTERSGDDDSERRRSTGDEYESDDENETPPPGDDSVLTDVSHIVLVGLFQFLIAGAVLVWWRARRRGTVVPEPRPVEVSADELLDGQAGLYRRSHDHAHIGRVLRTATRRRLCHALGVDAHISADALVDTVATRIGADPALVGAALHEPITDAARLELVAAQLEWIEAEVG